MCLVSHNLPVESTVQSKTGSGFWEMTILRIVMSIVIAFCLNWALPRNGWATIGVTVSAELYDNIRDVFFLWFTSSMKVIITISLVVTALMILHYILDEFKWMQGLSSLFAPLMAVFGLPRNTAFLWLVGNVVGLAYGGAIMVEQVEQKKLSYANSRLLNYHLAVSHSLLEDTIIFIAIGIPAVWIIVTRLFFAIVVVWLRRAYNYYYIKKMKAYQS
jgi:hypothetical protein